MVLGASLMTDTKGLQTLALMHACIGRTEACSYYVHACAAIEWPIPVYINAKPMTFCTHIEEYLMHFTQLF